MSDVLRYNQKKTVQMLPRKPDDATVRHRAELIHSSGFLKDTQRLTTKDMDRRFREQNALNTRTEKNTLHISLNFARGEQLDNDKLIAIAERYMQGIGFADQPYLVWQHHDAGHPHIHIMTTAIRADGSRIDLYRIGARLSEPARKAIESEFNLIPAQGLKTQAEQKLGQLTEPSKLEYGPEAETKQKMSDIIQFVGQAYKFTTIGEFNAILRQYNVVADQGKPGSRTYEGKGLTYRALDERGKKIGSTVKASDFEFRPTQKWLGEKFKTNEMQREEFHSAIRDKIDWVLLEKPKSVDEFDALLRQEGIRLIAWKNDQGQVYGLTYVDMEDRSAVNGRALGKEYTLGAIEARMEKQDAGHHLDKKNQHNQRQDQATGRGQSSDQGQPDDAQPTERRPDPDSRRGEIEVPEYAQTSVVPQFLSDLMGYTDSGGSMPQELREDKAQRRHRSR
jgi:Relaxase/Mobilisation nuclease domain